MSGHSAENDAPRWHNADGTTSPIVKATADAANVVTFDTLLGDPTQQLDPEGLVFAGVRHHDDTLRAEGWQACIDYIRREYNSWLGPEDTWWTERHNPFRTSVTPPGSGVAS